MPRTPAHFLLDEEPTWSIFDVALPITALDGIESEADWVPGIEAWYRADIALREPMRTHLAEADPSNDTVADPSAWPEAITTVPDVASFPTGLKGIAEDGTQFGARPFFVRTDRLVYELYQQWRDAGTDARAVLQAHVADQVADEMVDSLYTQNLGLSRTVALAEAASAGSADLSGASAATPARAISALYEANRLAGGGHRGVLSVPSHAVPFLVRDRLARWTDTGQLRDCYNNLVIPLTNPQGPLADPDDLESAPAPAAGEGWLWLHPRPYVGLTDPRPREVGDGPRQRGYAKVNEDLALAEAVAIVVFKPIRTFCVNTIMNTTAP